MKRICKTVFALGMAAAMSLAAFGCTSGGENEQGKEEKEPFVRVEDERTITDREFTALSLTATDDYGREVLPVDAKENDDRYVGLFYFLWLGQNAESSRGIYDMSEITENGTAIENFQVNDRSSPEGAAHFWGKPVWGYYNSTDEWVMRKQIEMLTLAGVDFLIFDCTNAFLYQNVTDVLFRVLLEYQNAGWNVPKVMYYLAAESFPGQYLQTLRDVYNYFYASDTYRSLWFMPDGKPIITMHQRYYYEVDRGLDLSDETDRAIYDLFEFKCRQWPNEQYEENGVPWMEFTPNAIDPVQPVHNGWMNVSVAQHVTVRFSDTLGTQGRGFDHTSLLTDHSRYGEDINYQCQWNTVLQNRDEVRFTFITGWNEWIATKFFNGSIYYTVDTFIPEFSRDLEPSENLGDNSYLLTAQKIRENNFTAAKHYLRNQATIDIETDDTQWGTLRAYVDFTNDCLDRNCRAMAGREVYTDTSGRNDIASVKVAEDAEYLYFRVETAGEITPYEAGDESWMNIWISTGGKDNYLGYNYVLNRSVTDGKTSVSRANGGKLEKCGEGDLRVEGNVLFVRVKRADLGLGGNATFSFKVTDHISEGSYLDFYRTGDSAPIGRFNYSYGY